MRRILARTVPATLLVWSLGSSVGAQTGPQIAPSPPARFFATRVQGQLRVPAAPSGALAGFGCRNITLAATSQELKPHDPNVFGLPKWVRTANATGTYASGTCSYSVPVPANSIFFLRAGGHGSFNCDVIEVWLNATGAALGPFTVPFATSRTVNATVPRLDCEVLY